jgi:hypothetical protein
VKVCPPIVSVADLAAPVVAAAENFTSPLPFPLDPDVIVSQDALLVAVHAHPDPVVTATVPEPPEAGTFCRSGERVYWHP